VKFGIKTRPEHVTWAQTRDVWVAADEIPVFESAWNWDHFYPLTGDLAGPNLEGWTTLAALAQATKRIRVGCQVTGMIYRHPAVLANMAAAVDIISEGRLDLGVGAGWNQLECDAYGIDLPTLGPRFDQFDEGVQVLISLLEKEETTFAGEYFTLTNARNEPKPLQRPHPPITIGGRGPKRTLLAVAKWAQQWNVILADPADWAPLKQTLREHCAAVGRDPGEIVCSVNVMVNVDEAANPSAGFGRTLELVHTYREVGVDLVVLNLPHGASPSVLDPLATAVAPLA
jgi:F420-dependent oxidoreductase-like protein